MKQINEKSTRQDIMRNFSESLNDLMFDPEISLSDLSKAININRVQLEQYKLNKSLINLENATKIANYFKVSLDYLFGLSDKQKEVVGDINGNFYERLIIELDKQSTSFYKMCKDLDFSENIKLNWKNGSLPQTDNLVRIAKYLSVSVDYLVGRTK